MNDPRTDYSALADHLASVGCQVKGKTASCPWHEDSTPSASIMQGQDGHWRIYCHKCDRHGHVLDLRAEASGIPLGDLLRQIDPGTKPTRVVVPVDKTPKMLANKSEVAAYAAKAGKVESWHIYGPKSAPVLVVARIRTSEGKKTFRQFTPTPDGYAASNLLPDGTIPLYRQDDIGTAATVLVVEGEKACNAAWSIGIPAVTSVMGAGKASLSDWSAIAGKHVVLWPDNDEPGAKHMGEVATIVQQAGAASVQLIDAEAVGLPPKGDIADLIEVWGADAQQHATEIRTLMADADHIGGAAPLTEWHRKVQDGTWRNLTWPLDVVGRMSRATMPGSMTLVCADPGAGKSWLMLQLSLYWETAGHRTAIRMFEDDMAAHLRRLLAHMSGEGGHTTDQWVRDNPGIVSDDMRTHRQMLDMMASRIVPETKELWTHDDLASWVEARAKSGCRVIMVDPITGLKTAREPWAADFTLAMRLKDIAYTYECSIIITTHPRGNNKNSDMNSMAGGVAWSRFAHCVLWLSHLGGVEDLQMIDGSTASCNRALRILKSRHGKGTGMTVGLYWSDMCRFDEIGIVDASKRKRTVSGGRVEAAKRSQADRLKRSPDASEDAFAG